MTRTAFDPAPKTGVFLVRDQINLKREIESDIKRYSSILAMYKSGKLKVGDVEGQERLIERTSQIARHLENVIRMLRALLRDG